MLPKFTTIANSSMSTTKKAKMTRLFYVRLLIALTVSALSGCSGVDVIADATATFEATHYTRYDWRSEPPGQASFGKDMLPQKSPLIRASFEEKMSELGYERVDRDEAQFLVEYIASAGYNDGELLRGGSNETLYPSSVNRQIDGASADNARALSGMVETGDIMLVFVDAKTAAILWRVQMSMVVEDANRIEESEVRKALRQGLANLPPAT